MCETVSHFREDNYCPTLKDEICKSEKFDRTFSSLSLHHVSSIASSSSCLFSKTAGNNPMSFHIRLPLETQNKITLSEEQRLKPEPQNLWLIMAHENEVTEYRVKLNK